MEIILRGGCNFLLLINSNSSFVPSPFDIVYHDTTLPEEVHVKNNAAYH